MGRDERVDAAAFRFARSPPPSFTLSIRKGNEISVKRANEQRRRPSLPSSVSLAFRTSPIETERGEFFFKFAFFRMVITTD